MAFVLEKTPKPGEPGRDFYDFIDGKVTQPIRGDWVIDKERGVVLFYTGNNSRSLGEGDAKFMEHFFTMAGKDLGRGIGVYEEIVSEEKKSDDCLMMKINLRLSELTPELWAMAKEALAEYGDYGSISDYLKFELVVLNDDAIKGAK